MDQGPKSAPRNYQTVIAKYRRHYVIIGKHFLEKSPNVTKSSQRKNKQMGSHPTKKLLYSREHDQQSKEGTNRMRENL